MGYVSPEYQREYRKNNLEKVKARWKKNHPDKKKLAASSARWGRTTNGKWRTLAAISRRKEMEFDISLEEYGKLIAGNKCIYCDGPLNETSGSLDRLDSGRGYVVGNVVPCCRACNTVKFDVLTFEEMIEIKPVLIRARLRRESESL